MKRRSRFFIGLAAAALTYGSLMAFVGPRQVGAILTGLTAMTGTTIATMPPGISGTKGRGNLLNPITSNKDPLAVSD